MALKAQRFRKAFGGVSDNLRTPANCLRSPNTALHLRCSACAEEPPVIHQPIRLGGKWCAGCCPCCGQRAKAASA
jgi:hypothetical protein